MQLLTSSNNTVHHKQTTQIVMYVRCKLSYVWHATAEPKVAALNSCCHAAESAQVHRGVLRQQFICVQDASGAMKHALLGWVSRRPWRRTAAEEVEKLLPVKPRKSNLMKSIKTNQTHIPNSG